MLAAAPRGSLGARVALALAAHGMQRSVGAADEMEPVTHDPGDRSAAQTAWRYGSDGSIEMTSIARARQRAGAASHRWMTCGASRDRIDHASDQRDGRQAASMAMLCFIQ